MVMKVRTWRGIVNVWPMKMFFHIFSTFRTLIVPYNKNNFLSLEMWRDYNNFALNPLFRRTWTSIMAHKGTVGDLPFPKDGGGCREFLSLSLQVGVLFACWAAQLSKGLPWDMTGLDLEGAGHWIALVILASHSYVADSSFWWGKLGYISRWL